MENYYVSCKKNTSNKNSSVRRTKQNRVILASNCTVFKRKSMFIKNHKFHKLVLNNFNNI